MIKVNKLYRREVDTPYHIHQAIVDGWKRKREEGYNHRLEDYFLYALFRGKDWRKCVTYPTNETKIKHQKSDLVLKSEVRKSWGTLRVLSTMLGEDGDAFFAKERLRDTFGDYLIEILDDPAEYSAFVETFKRLVGYVNLAPRPPYAYYYK